MEFVRECIKYLISLTFILILGSRIRSMETVYSSINVKESGVKVKTKVYVQESTHILNRCISKTFVLSARAKVKYTT